MNVYKTSGDVLIDTNLVQKLIHEQFPQWQSMLIHPVAQSGWDNRTFHLGQDMVVRLPSSQQYAPQIKKEYQCLQTLAQQLSYKITTPIALGQPSSHYPWHWSINTWLDGESASRHSIDDMKRFAKDLGAFLKEFHSLSPFPGLVLSLNGEGTINYVSTFFSCP